MVEIETESLGKALIATDLGFSVEAIKNGVNGFKVGLGDTQGFVQTIKMMWENPEMCKTMGMNARVDYEAKYLPEDNYKQLVGIYESLFDARRL